MAKTLAISFSMKIYFIYNSEELSKSLGYFLFVCFLLFSKLHKHQRNWAA